MRSEPAGRVQRASILLRYHAGDIVSEIAASAREQTTGMEQVSTAIAEMDKVTQQNAASAEQSSSAASELNGQAEELASMVATFQLEGGAAPRSRSRMLRA